jgi:hypothetical protein
MTQQLHSWAFIAEKGKGMFTCKSQTNVHGNFIVITQNYKQLMCQIFKKQQKKK